jgi:hypothetical protein
MYGELKTSARWYEESRERSASMIVAANSIILGLIASAGFQLYAIVACPVIYMLAELGQFFALKYHVLAEKEHSRARVIRAKIDCLAGPEAYIEKAFAQADQEHQELLQTSPLAKLLVSVVNARLHQHWHRLHTFFKLMSLVAATAIVLRWALSL